jgi:uncharacterized protein (TIGR03435 family)
MLNAVHGPTLLISLALSSAIAFGQASTAAPAFDVASVKPCQHVVGPDYNNQLIYSPTEFKARNVTMKRLLAEAYLLQVNQVTGPSWIDQNEYDIDARAAGGATREQMALMLRRLVRERFNLKQHSEMREMRVYELGVDQAGPKIRPFKDGEAVQAGGGFHFHGDLRQFADFLAVQLSIPATDNPAEPVRASTSLIPVVDKTGLAGVFDFAVDVHPELGTDGFTTWRRALQDQLGLRIESRKESVAVLVIDDARRIPTEN